MRVHDRMHVRPHAIDQQVHADFAGHLSAPLQLAPHHVDDHEISGFHHAFRHARWRDQHALAIQPHRNVAIAGGYKAALVKHYADFEDAFPGFVFAFHALTRSRVW